MRKFLIPFTAVLAASLSLASAAEGKSLWQSFVDFFSPDEEPQGEGPLYRQLADLDRDIHKNEQAYSRERRPQKKAYLKSHIGDLRRERSPPPVPLRLPRHPPLPPRVQVHRRVPHLPLLPLPHIHRLRRRVPRPRLRPRS